MGQQLSFDIVSLAQSIAKHGISSAGAIVDVSGSVPEEEIRKVAKALAPLPASAVSMVALTDTDVLFSGSKDAAVSKMTTGRMRGGGTDFKRVVEKAWIAMNKPPALILISDGETPEWPKPFPVPTVILLIDRTLNPNALPGSTFNYASYSKELPVAGKGNVLAIEKIALPQIQNMRRGLE